MRHPLKLYLLCFLLSHVIHHDFVFHHSFVFRCECKSYLKLKLLISGMLKVFFVAEPQPKKCCPHFSRTTKLSLSLVYFNKLRWHTDEHWLSAQWNACPCNTAGQTTNSHPTTNTLFYYLMLHSREKKEPHQQDVQKLFSESGIFLFVCAQIYM